MRLPSVTLKESLCSLIYSQTSRFLQTGFAACSIAPRSTYEKATYFRSSGRRRATTYPQVAIEAHELTVVNTHSSVKLAMGVRVA